MISSAYLQFQEFSRLFSEIFGDSPNAFNYQPFRMTSFSEPATRNFRSMLSSTIISYHTAPPSQQRSFLFRALLQRNNKVLKNLIQSLLHLTSDEITLVEIANSIELGTTVDEKEFILDIKVHMNSSVTINLEMQVINEHNWVDRSTCYLCRTYSNLNRGDDYTSAKTVIQIGLLDFTLFPERPEFYATYKLINEKNFFIYSNKLRLSVVDLTHIDLATEEDRHYGIDAWASFFKANKRRN